MYPAVHPAGSGSSLIAQVQPAAPSTVLGCAAAGGIIITVAATPATTPASPGKPRKRRTENTMGPHPFNDGWATIAAAQGLGSGNTSPAEVGDLRRLVRCGGCRRGCVGG